MKNITLDSGLQLNIDEEWLDDMEVLDLLIAIDKEEDPTAIAALSNKILGPKQKKLVYDSLRNEKGRVPSAAFAAAIQEIFAKLGDKGKN